MAEKSISSYVQEIYAEAKWQKAGRKNIPVTNGK